MAKIHFILQGTDRVGKSVVSSFLFQYLSEKGLHVKGLDIDPVNNIFASYKEFNVEILNIMNTKKEIDTRLFDGLIEATTELPQETHLIIDNGASSYVSLKSYLADGGALDVLKDYGHEIYLHTIIIGSQSMLETISNLKELAEDFPNYPLIVWKNSYFGKIEINGKKFEEMKVYEEHHQQFLAVIDIPIMKKDTFGKDVETLLMLYQSFKAGINSSLPMMVRSRLNTYWNALLNEIDSKIDFSDSNCKASQIINEETEQENVIEEEN